MEIDGIPDVDIVGTLFLICALVSLLWSMRRRQFNIGDDEASRVLWTADDRSDITASEEVHRRPVTRGMMIAAFVVILATMVIAPIVTIMAAQRATARAGSGYAYPAP